MNSAAWSVLSRAAQLNAARSLIQPPGSGTSITTAGDGDGAEENCSTTGASSAAGNPIMIATGNKVQFETDYVGKGDFPLSIRRTYNRAWTGTSEFGEKWMSNFSRRLTFVFASSGSLCNIGGLEPGIAPPANCESYGNSSETATKVIAHRPDGKKIVFTKDTNGNS